MKRELTAQQIATLSRVTTDKQWTGAEIIWPEQPLGAFRDLLVIRGWGPDPDAGQGYQTRLETQYVINGDGTVIDERGPDRRG